eukprot:1175394-Prorocentrum_minimum.AAC.2
MDGRLAHVCSERVGRSSTRLVRTAGGKLLGYPESGLGYPESGLGYPESGLGYPGSGLGYPESGLGYPGSGLGYPGSYPGDGRASRTSLLRRSRTPSGPSLHPLYTPSTPPLHPKSVSGEADATSVRISITETSRGVPCNVNISRTSPVVKH